MPNEYYRAQHLEYLKTLKLRYSVLIKSEPRLSGRDLSELSRLPVNREIRREAETLLAEIRLHELFFSSFGESAYSFSMRATERTPSSAGLLYSVKRAALSLDTGFVTLAVEKGRVDLLASRTFSDHFRNREPRLAVDLCEHAYFGDYGFSRERYLDECLPYLSVGRLFGAETSAF